MPASSKTVRIELPAITPEPGADGRKINFAAPNRPFVGCGIEFELVNGIEIIRFLPSVTPFRTAVITSPAFPTPTPTFPCSLLSQSFVVD